MKTKDLKNKIKEDIYLLTPDVISKIDFKNLEVEEKEIKEKQFVSKLNKLMIALSSTLALGIALVFIVINFSNSPSIQTRNLSFEAKEEIYSLSTFSSVMLLYQQKQLETSLMSDEVESELLINNQLDILNQYLNFLEPLVTDKNNLLFEIKTSSNINFKKEIKFTSILLNGVAVDYVLYYNEEVNADETILIGIMEFLNEEYSFNGVLKKVNEQEEFSLKAYQISNQENYIEVEYKVENTKQKFNYSIYENDEEIFESEIRIELDEDGVFIELEYETDEKEINFLIYKENQNNTIYVEYEIENEESEEGYIIISVVYDNTLLRNVYNYQIHFGDSEIEYEKDRVIDDEEDEDEEEDEEEDD